ncbi:MAG: hypothetical protein NE334_16440 [Lentisphaeraceae bacterium]|nr:hypothetical protein [Lentisphaeraceae bacterium]
MKVGGSHRYREILIDLPKGVFRMFNFRWSHIAAGFLLLALTSFIYAEDKVGNRSGVEFEPLLIKVGQTVISETFGQSSKKIKRWVRYGTRWGVVDGAFVGRPASEAYQKSHPGKHSGLSPRLEMRIPECPDGFLMKFDFKFDAKVDFAHFWLGHHRFKLIIQGDQAILQCSQDARNKNITRTPLKSVSGPFKVNQWYSVHMEAHGSQRIIQLSGFEPLVASGISLSSEKLSVVRISGSQGIPLYIDNFQFIKGAGLLKP